MFKPQMHCAKLPLPESNNCLKVTKPFKGIRKAETRRESYWPGLYHRTIIEVLRQKELMNGNGEVLFIVLNMDSAVETEVHLFQ